MTFCSGLLRTVPLIPQNDILYIYIIIFDISICHDSLLRVNGKNVGRKAANVLFPVHLKTGEIP